MSRIRFFFAIACLIALLPAAAFAQTATAAATTTDAKPAVTATIVEDSNSHETRGELSRLLDRYPPELERVLRLDPTLLSNPAYMATYPALAAFLAEHPEVAHSPRFFLGGVPEDPSPQAAASRMFEQLFEYVAIVTIVAIVSFAFVFLIRTILEHRRWSRLAKVQTDVHNKLMDRFTSNEDMLAYVQSPAGRRLLEAGPMPEAGSVRPVAAPVSRILWSVQVGVVLVALGVGFLFVSGTVEPALASPFTSLGVIAMSVGAGFIVSALVSFAISRRLGLFETLTASAAE